MFNIVSGYFYFKQVHPTAVFSKQMNPAFLYDLNSYFCSMEEIAYMPKIPKFEDMILFENQDIIAINKPAFVSSLNDRGGASRHILKMAKAYYSEAQLCHRLDKETSGVLLIAKNPETYRLASIEFEKRRVNKVYHAIIEGVHKMDALKVDLPILNMGNKHVSIDKARGKKAETWFESLEYFQHYTLIACRPVSGRMHQIRIHLASQRATIAGDDMYGGKPVFLSKFKRGFTLAKHEEERPIMQRFALHAYTMGIRLGKEDYNFQAPYPKDFATLLKQLRKYDGNKYA